MAKDVRESLTRSNLRRLENNPVLRNDGSSVSLNFRRDFTGSEIAEVEQLRTEMEDRLYASG